MDLKRLLVMTVFCLLFSSVFSLASISCTIPSQTELNKDLTLKCSSNYTLATYCLVESFDSNDNVVQTWHFIPDDNGYLLKSVVLDNRYSIGKNYTMNVTCGSETASQNVFVDVEGNIGLNLFAGNVIAYSIAHPEEVLGAGLISFLGIVMLTGLVRFIRK